MLEARGSSSPAPSSSGASCFRLRAGDRIGESWSYPESRGPAELLIDLGGWDTYCRLPWWRILASSACRRLVS